MMIQSRGKCHHCSCEILISHVSSRDTYLATGRKDSGMGGCEKAFDMLSRAGFSHQRIGQNRRRAGFTLIEILVVVAIIALLISILLPSLARARSQAKNTLCLSNLRQLGTAMQTYASQWKDIFSRGASVTDPVTGLAERTNWVTCTNYIMGDHKSYTSINQVPLNKRPILECPERAPTIPAPFVDYVVNAMHPNGSLGDNPGAPPAWSQVRFSRLSLYRNASDVLYLADEELEDKNQTGSTGTSLKDARLNWQNTNWNPPPNPPPTALDILDVWKGEQLPENSSNPTDDPGPRRIARKMHLNRYTNAVFLDGHAAGMQLAGRATDVDNYTLWLIRMGVQNVNTVKTLPLN